MTLEQKRALAVARARRRAAEEKPDFEREAEETLKPSFGKDVLRQLGLTARHGIEGVGGVLSLPGMVADAVTSAVGIDAPKFNSHKVFENLADRLMLPKPENAMERVAGDAARTMAGVAGFSGGASLLSPYVSAGAKPAIQSIVGNQGLQQLSAAGAGAGGGMAREAEVGPLGQLVASIVGGVGAPAAVGAAGKVAGMAGDIGATVASALGSKAATKKLAADAMTRTAGEDRGKIVAALRSAEKKGGATPTAAEAIAEAQIGKPEQFGGGVVRLQKDLSGAQGIENILPTAVRRQKADTAEFLRDLKNATATIRNQSLDAANKNGVKTGPILQKIDDVLADADLGSPELVQKVLTHVRGKIADITNDIGVADARRLYTIRKEMGPVIKRYSVETATWDKKLAGGIDTTVQRAIDDAIEAAGGARWKEYLQKFSAGMREVDAQRARTAEAKLIAAGIKSLGSNLGSGDVPKLPTLLSRPMMFVNYLLNIVKQDANTPVAREIAQRMTKAEDLVALLERKPSDPMRQVLERAINKTAIAVIAGENNNAER